jgi:MSHA biogenesis protein MshQ
MRHLLALFICVLLHTPGFSSAAPGDILFSDDFETGGAGCASLSGNWTTTSTARSGTSTQTANSGTCSMFTNAGEVFVSSTSIDLSAVTGTRLTAWVRKGADSFSEDPDTDIESLELQARTSGGGWATLQTFSATGLADGAGTSVLTDLPAWALHSTSAFRFHQLGGSGATWDYWHVDDFILTETGMAPPSGELSANGCDDFESGLAAWSLSNTIRAGISGATSQSPSNALYTRHGAVTVTSVPVAAGNVETLSAWIRRGADTFSEDPDGGENLVVSYLDDAGGWVALETFTGSGTQGEVFNRTWSLPANARHGGLQIRFEQTGGSGSDFDYWHIDDVCLASAMPDLSATKSVSVEADPMGNAAPMAIPGAWMRYSIEVTNTGAGSVDDATMSISDDIDPQTTLFTGDLDGAGSPVIFTDGSGADTSGLSLPFSGLASASDAITFLDRKSVV